MKKAASLICSGTPSLACDPSAAGIMPTSSSPHVAKRDCESIALELGKKH